jgi:hypothetical protein
MPPRINPLKLNPLQLKTLTLIQELGRLIGQPAPEEAEGAMPPFRLPMPMGWPTPPYGWRWSVRA